MARKKVSFRKMLMKHFFISILLGCFPSLIFFFIEPTRHDALKKVQALVPGNAIQWYLIGAVVIYFVLSSILKFMSFPNSRVQEALLCIREIFKEAVSGIRNIIQTMVGAILTFCIFWYYVEPQSFTLLRLLFLILVSSIFMVYSAAIEMGDRYIED